MASFDALRAELREGSGVRRINVVRGGQVLSFDLTPENGRIGVAPRYERRRLSAGGALSRALAVPAQMLHAVLRTASGSARTELSGPVAIVRETADQSSSGDHLMLLGTLAVYFSLWIPGLHLFDAVTSLLFRVTHAWSEAPSAEARVRRLARFHQSIWVAAALFVVFSLLAVIHDASEHNATLPALLLVMPGASALVVLNGLVAVERWGRWSALGASALSALVPCVALGLSISLALWLRSELRRLHQRVGGLISKPTHDAGEREQ